MLDNHTNQLDNKVEDAIARAQTPAPVQIDENADVRDKVSSDLFDFSSKSLQIRAYLNGEKYNEAFTAALMQSNLGLVVDTMESVDSAKIFSPEAGTCLEARGDKYSNKNKQQKSSQAKGNISKPKIISSNTSTFPKPSLSLTPSNSPQVRPRSAKLIKSEYKLKPKALPERPVETNYNNLTSEIISSCESFYDSDHYSSKSIQNRSLPRKDSAFLDDSDMDIRSSTDTKLSRFFLLNKY